MAFSADGRRLATGSDHGTVRIWDTATGRLSVGPLDHLARALLPYPECGRKIFTCYDNFLAALNDDTIRKTLERTNFDAALSDPTFDMLRNQSHSYREGIEDLFFDLDPTLKKWIRKVGVF